MDTYTNTASGKTPEEPRPPEPPKMSEPPDLAQPPELPEPPAAPDLAEEAEDARPVADPAGRPSRDPAARTGDPDMEPGTPTPDADSLSRTTMRLGRLLMRHEHLTRSGRHGRSTRVGQGRVLALLALREPLGQKDLAYLLGVRPQSLSELLRKLEHAGLVTRQRDEQDRRSTLVSLTAEGRGAAEEAARSGAEGDDPFDVLEEGERVEFARLAGKVSQALIDADGEPGPRGPRDGGRRGGGPHHGDGHGHGHGGHAGRGPRWEEAGPAWEGTGPRWQAGPPRGPWEGEPRNPDWDRPEGPEAASGRRDRDAFDDSGRGRGWREHGHDRRRWARNPFRMGGPAWA
ncbi:MAG: MarR family transcriptional regulator [Propionibacterium sp.]|nr:MarR family transcriptional regulator [Propionibacterium sp.]